jgi:hypothetical protein
MLGLAAICWAIWNARNNTCFERKKHIKLPNDIMFSACMFMKYWAGLYPDESQSAIEAGVEIMMKTAINVMKSQEVQRAPRRITGDAGRGDVCAVSSAAAVISWGSIVFFVLPGHCLGGSGSLEWFARA